MTCMPTPHPALAGPPTAHASGAGGASGAGWSAHVNAAGTAWSATLCMCVAIGGDWSSFNRMQNEPVHVAIHDLPSHL